jgi:hypothetical protein
LLLSAIKRFPISVLLSLAMHLALTLMSLADLLSGTTLTAADLRQSMTVLRRLFGKSRPLPPTQETMNAKFLVDHLTSFIYFFLYQKKQQQQQID